MASVKPSFSSASRANEISYHSQVKWLINNIGRLTNNWEKEVEQGKDKLAIGLDEISFSGHDMLLTLTNLTDHLIKGIFPNNSKRTLTKALEQIPGIIAQKIRWVCIDMNYNYLKTIKEVLPQAKVVIDHFHVISYANKQIDEQRRIIQDYRKKEIPKKIWLKNKENLDKKEKEKIKKFLKKFPEMKLYWLAKEKLRQMYTKPNRTEAQKLLRAIINKLANTDDPGLHKWAKTLTRFEDQILNYFDSGGLTNAYTEGVNNKLKLIKRTSFGFRNKEVFIAKALFSFLWVLYLPH
jgi:transposase